MVAQQATEFAPGPLFGNQLNAAVAGAAFRTGDVGFLHRPNMRQRRNRSSPVPLPPRGSDLVQRSKAQQAALSDKLLNLKPASRNRTKEAIVNVATHMLAEKFFLVLETVISHTYRDGSPRVVSTSRHVPIKPPSESAK